MPSSTTDPSVDKFLSKSTKWPAELAKLRGILLDCGLTETMKWRVPCYSFEAHNIAVMGELNDCCTLGFFKGVLLSDAEGILTKPGENTQSARNIRFTSVQQITELEPVLRATIREAIEIEKAGVKVEFKKSSDFPLPEEFESKLASNPALKAAFEALTPGRQRAYNLHFSSAKQSKTRESRIEKCLPQILAGKGWNE